MGGMGDE